jgi:penicillin-binding protein 1A
MRLFKAITFVFVGFLMLSILVMALVTNHYSSGLPSLDALVDYNPRLTTVIYDRNGEPLTEIFSERRMYLRPEEIPSRVADAFISAEDDEFFNHRGVNPLTILRAAIRNLQAGHTVQGGSTITQQVAKSLLLSPERTLDRKIKELILAFRMERALNKQQILALYLNQIFLGNGAYGIEAAAQTYFNKHAKDLTIPEAAILGGLPRAPSRDNPISNPRAAIQRRDYVLGRMLATQRISKEEYEQSINTSIPVYNLRERLSPIPYATEFVRRYLMSQYGSEKVLGGGLQVYTTFDLALGKAAQDSLKNGLLTVDKRIGLRKPQKKLNSDKEISKYLEQSHKEITETYFGHQILTPQGELKSPAKADEPTPIELGKNYVGVVLGKNKKTRIIEVQVGTHKGTIHPEDYRWATESDPDEVYPEKVIRNPFVELERGHLVTVQPKIIEPGKDEFLLEQEPLVQGSLVSYSIPEGDMLTLVGGYDFYITRSEFNRAIQAVRQPGSVFKAFVYAAALESGLTPSTIIVDSPIVYRNADEKSQIEKVWRPDNFSEKFYGDTRLRESLTWSRNIPTIKLLQHVKIQNVIEFCKKIGIHSPLSPDLSIALGSSGVTLDELVRAYGVFANQGKRLSNHFIQKIEDRNGNVLEEFKKPADESVVSESTSFLMSSILKDVVEIGTGTAVKPLGRPVAGKTGTTNDFKDALFVGYVPQMTTGVWVGFDEDRPLGRNETGGRAAAPIWLQYMQMATAKVPSQDFAPPESVQQTQIDEITGDVPTSRTRKRVKEWFGKGSIPGETRPETAVPGTPSLPAETFTNGSDRINRTIVITGNPDLQSVPKNPNPETENDVGSDEFLRNDL